MTLLDYQYRQDLRLAVSAERKARLPEREARIETKPRGPNGRPPLVELSDGQVEEAWRVYCAGQSLRELAAYYAPTWGLTEHQARDALNYRFHRAGYKLRAPKEGLLNWASRELAMVAEADRRVEGEAA